MIADHTNNETVTEVSVRICREFSASVREFSVKR